MSDKGLRETLEEALDELAEPGFPTDRAPLSPAMRARYQARGRDIRAAAFTAALKWLLHRLNLRGHAPGRRDRKSTAHETRGGKASGCRATQRWNAGDPGRR